MTNSIDIQVFLSYRHKNAQDIEARDILKQHCANEGLKLIFDKEAINKGDKLIVFMNDLSAARCVILLLSAEYFQSAYTLYELISIYDQANLEKRLIQPVRVTEDMVAYVRTTAEINWKEDKAIRDELARLLEENDHDILWQRIDAAWEAIISPYIDELDASLEESDMSTALKENVHTIQEAVQTVVQNKTQTLHNKITTEIENILNNQHIPNRALATPLHIDHAATPTEITNHLLKKETGDAMDIIYDISTEQENQRASRPEYWDEYMYDVEQLCGWLLINSIDPNWWFQNEFKLKQTHNNGITNRFSLDDPGYIEVIISRSLLQQARYRLDDQSEIKPVSKTHDALLFDAVSPDATDIQLLSRIYKDLRRAGKAPQNVQQLLKKIQLTIRARPKGTFVYYIIPQAELELLQSRNWFAQTQQQLAGHLQFICCDQQDKLYDQNPCREEQDLLLEKYAYILRLNNQKPQSHD